MESSRARVAITDSSFLGHLSRLDRLDLLGRLSPLEFVVPEQVLEEVSDPEAGRIERALSEGLLREAAGMNREELRTYTAFRRAMGRGEAACLALALARGWIVASDERGLFRAHVREQLGEGRSIDTAAVLLTAIRSEVLTVEEAEHLKAILEHAGFDMHFASFRDLLPSSVEASEANEARYRGSSLAVVVDAGEATCGLAELLRREWDHVEVRRLKTGDIAVGERVLIERKTVNDYLASIDDGRLFRQAFRLAGAVARPLFILEGDPEILTGRIAPGALRGVELAIAVGYHIPVLSTRDLTETAACVRHIAAREARRRGRGPRPAPRKPVRHEGTDRASPGPLPPEAFDALLALPGVGMERARAIAERVGSLSELCGLGVRDLLSVPGIGPDTAAGIVDTLRSLSTGGGSRRG